MEKRINLVFFCSQEMCLKTGGFFHIIRKVCKIKYFKFILQKIGVGLGVGVAVNNTEAHLDTPMIARFVQLKQSPSSTSLLVA